MPQRKTEEPKLEIERREACDVLHIMQGGKELQVPGFPVTQPRFDTGRAAAKSAL
jgi:hypothetical protein